MNPTTVNAVENLQSAQQRAVAIRPRVGGFPVLAEVLRQAGARKNIWHLPAAQSLFLTDLGPVVSQGTPLVSGVVAVREFDSDAVVKAIRVDQAGESTFPEFLQAIWEAGVVSYEVDFGARKVAYFGWDGTNYIEAYPEVRI